MFYDSKLTKKFAYTLGYFASLFYNYLLPSIFEILGELTISLIIIMKSPYNFQCISCCLFHNDSIIKAVFLAPNLARKIFHEE